MWDKKNSWDKKFAHESSGGKRQNFSPGENFQLYCILILGVYYSTMIIDFKVGIYAIL